MHKFVILLWVCVFYPVFALADTILNVDVLGTFRATQPCASNCTETIEISFQFDASAWSDFVPTVSVIPGTLQVSASGFLGSFSGSGIIHHDQHYMAFSNANADEIDILTGVIGRPVFPLGLNTLGLELFACQSQACIAAFGTSWRGSGFLEASPLSTSVTTVPENGGFFDVVLTFAVLRGTKLWRSRRAARADKYTNSAH